MKHAFLLVFLSVFISHFANAQAITTVAGCDTNITGDGGPATSAGLNQPYAVALDNLGNYYIADRNNYRIRKVDAAGIVTTIAGTGNAAFSGDGGPANLAEINYPISVAVDAVGNVYFSDRFSERIRRIDGATGIISTIAGIGTSGFSGDGGPATAAEVSGPCGIVFDSIGNIFFCDIYNNRIRKLDVAGMITTIAGRDSFGFGAEHVPATVAQFYLPYGVAFDKSGNLYTAEFGTNRVRKIDRAGIVATIAGTGVTGFSGDGGPASAAQFKSLTGIAVDKLDNIFIADPYNLRVRRINSSGIVSTYAGNGASGFVGDGGSPTSAGMGPTGIAVNEKGDVYIADLNNNRVRLIKSILSISGDNAITPQCKLFPDPCHDVLNIDLGNSFSGCTTIIIRNMLGQVVLHHTANSRQCSIPLALPPAGYIFSVTDANNITTSRFTVD